MCSFCSFQCRSYWKCFKEYTFFVNVLIHGTTGIRPSGQNSKTQGQRIEWFHSPSGVVFRTGHL